MHPSIDWYLVTLERKGRSPLTLKATRQDLARFVVWWEATRHRHFDPALLLDRDVRAWRIARQRDDGAAPATINRGLSALRGYCAWATAAGVLTENPTGDVADVTLPPLAPRSLPPDAVDALLRVARGQTDTPLRLRDEALLALLIYTGLRAQEVCDVQLRDLDLAGGTVIVRSGKAGKARRVPLHADAQHLLQRYLTGIRCPSGLPAMGSPYEREPLLGRIEMTTPGRPLRPGITQRVVQRVVERLGAQAATQFRMEAGREQHIEQAAHLLDLAQRLEHTTPHTLRHSLARRLLSSGAHLSEVQRVLGHSRLSTTGVYLTPSEDDLREALGRAGV